MTTPLRHSKALVIVSAGDTKDEPGQPRRRNRGPRLVDRGSNLFNRTLLGFTVVALLVFGIGAWGTTAQLSGAVIAPGLLVVDSNVKRVQHPTGGVVADIRVRNGEQVQTGDVLVTLENGQSRAMLAIHDNKILQLESEKSRLIAERDGTVAMTFPVSLDATNPSAKKAFDEESRLLDARRSGWASQRARLGERIVQIRREIDAIVAQRSAKGAEIELIRQELKLVDDMYKRQLSNITRLIGMKRELARFEGDKGALDAQIARAQSSIHEIELQIVELNQRIVTDVHKQVREIDGQLVELAERKATVEDQVRRTELRAPVSGTVHELVANTVGGVVRPGETVMSIVPQRDALSVEVRIAPKDIDQVTVGQRALLRFSSLNKEQTPELPGIVGHVGADLSREPSTGREFFLARIEVNPQAIAKAEGFKLTPGMPVDSFIETDQRTALSYLMKPFTDQVARAMRE